MTTPSITPEQALRLLLDKIDLIHADERYKSVWMLAAVHGHPYLGPDYAAELQAARDTLADKVAPAVPDGYKDLVRTAIVQLYQAMKSSYENDLRIYSFDLDLVHEHVRLLGLGGCLDAAMTNVAPKETGK